MIQITFLDKHLENPKEYTYVILICRYQDGWLWVRHRERSTWELPAGHLDPGETAEEAAVRELFEETGTILYTMFPVISYQGFRDAVMVYGKIYFVQVMELGPLPKSEIRQVVKRKRLPSRLTYPELQPLFFKKGLSLLNPSQLIF